jgi:hypothetical protein
MAHMETMAPTQIDTVNGQVAHVINNHHCHTHSHSHQHHHTVHAHGPVHVHTHVQSPTFALQAPPAPQARPAKRSRSSYDLSTGQKEILSLMRPLPKHVRGGVLEFMRAEFGTGLVMELAPDELQRMRRVVLDARRTAGI